MAGGLGGMGGFGGLLGALGQALLSSPRENPFQTLPQTMQAANERARQQQQEAAMASVAQRLGIDPALAVNPQAMSLLIGQQNLQKQLGIGAELNGAIASAFGAPGGVGGWLPGAPSAPSLTGGGTRSMTMPSGASAGVENEFLSSIRGAGLTNPVGLAAVGAYGSRESGFSPANVNRTWSDPSESGQAGTSGGIMSWRGPRLQALQTFARERGESGNGSPATQALFLAQEDPSLLPRLQAAKSPAEANQIMAGAWKFAGWDRPGGENQARLKATEAYLGRVGGLPTPNGANPATTVTATAEGTVAPYQVAASGGKIPVPIPENATQPLAASGYAPETRTMQELAKRKQLTALQIIARSSAMGDAGKPYADIGRLMFEDASQYLKPTDLERNLTAAGIDPRSAQGQQIMRENLDKRPETVRVAEYATGGRADEPAAQRQSRDLVRRGLPDNRPDVVRLGEAAQDFPGILRSGIEAEAARKGADTAATSRATAMTRNAEAATSAARTAARIMPALDAAERAFEQAAKGGGTGAWAAGDINRFFAARGPAWAGPSHANEIARQNFEKAIAAVQLAKASVDLKGQGPAPLGALDFAVMLLLLWLWP